MNKPQALHIIKTMIRNEFFDTRPAPEDHVLHNFATSLYSVLFNAPHVDERFRAAENNYRIWEPPARKDNSQ